MNMNDSTFSSSYGSQLKGSVHWLNMRILRNQKALSQGGVPLFLRRQLRALAYILNLHSLVLAGVSCLSVYICYTYNFRYNMDFTLVATGTTFPLVFTISNAFNRREHATVLIANMKASIVALYFMHRDWDQGENYPYSLGCNSNSWARGARDVLYDFCLNCQKYLASQDVYESIAERRLTAKQHDELLEFFVHRAVLEEETTLFAKTWMKFERRHPGYMYLAACYNACSKLSVLNEQLTARAGYTRGGEGGFSRTNQYLRYIISNLEELRMLKEYRTPMMMRLACGVILNIFAVVLAPYWAHFCDSWISLGNRETTCPAGYAGALVYVVIVMLLFHIQLDIEQPFDGTGLDDVFFTLPEELDESIGGPLEFSGIPVGGDAEIGIGSPCVGRSSAGQFPNPNSLGGASRVSFGSTSGCDVAGQSPIRSAESGP